MKDPPDQTQTIVSEGDTRGEGFGLLLLALVFGVPGVWLLVTPGAARIAGVVVSLLAAVFMGFAVKALRTHRRMDPGVLHVPSTSFLLSSTVPARFQRRVKRGSRDVRSLTARMVLQEWVRYTVGTDTRTATHDVVQRPIPIRSLPDPRGVSAELELPFPTYPPSFEASNNKVRWLLIIDVMMTDGFREDSVLPLWVVPATQIRQEV